LNSLSLSNPGPTRFANNPQDSNSVLDFVFLSSSNNRFGQYSLYPELQKPSDHVLLIIEVDIKEVNVNIAIQSIKNDSDKEKEFTKVLINSIECIDISAITSRETLQSTVLQVATIFENAWDQYSKLKYITKTLQRVVEPGVH